MIIDISDILSCENKEETKQVQIELTSFISKLGEFPIISAAPIELRIANRENKRLLIQGDVDLQCRFRAAVVWRKFRQISTFD